jgi:protoporphyrinogen/coproporphyrinogen III oxidase
MPDSRNAVVIGGGISGLACVYRLKQLGIGVTLFEESDRPGGVIGSVEQNGFLFEKGPQSFLGTPPLIEMIRALGLSDELLEADPRAPRYVFVHKRLQMIPMSPGALLTSSLLSYGTRLRVLAEPLRRTKPPGAEESVAAFVRRKFGHEILEYLVTPFVSGVYAGDPERLSLKSSFPSLAEWEEKYGSVLRGAMKSRSATGQPRPTLCSFRRGLSTLFDRLVNAFGDSVEIGVRADTIERAPDGGNQGFGVRVSQVASARTHLAQAVILATPAYRAAHLLKNLSGRLATLLSGIAYAPVAVIANGYHRRQVGHTLQGFGFLVPRKEGLRVLGTVWNSSLFPRRAPDGMVVLTSFAGGATDPAIVQIEPNSLAELIEAEVAKVLEITGPPAERAVWRLEKGLPQYNLGHAETVGSIREEAAGIPGIFLSGNYLEGPSWGNCVEQAYRTAESVRDFLTGKN